MVHNIPVYDLHLDSLCVCVCWIPTDY